MKILLHMLGLSLLLVVAPLRGADVAPEPVLADVPVATAKSTSGVANEFARKAVVNAVWVLGVAILNGTFVPRPKPSFWREFYCDPLYPLCGEMYVPYAEIFKNLGCSVVMTTAADMLVRAAVTWLAGYLQQKPIVSATSPSAVDGSQAVVAS